MNDIENEREELRTIQGIFENAVKENTMGDIRPHADKDFSYVSFSDRAFSDFDSFEKQWGVTRKEMIGGGSFETQLKPEPSLFSGDIAVCYGNSHNKLKDRNGNEFEFPSNWTVVFKKDASGWKALRAHNSMNPFSNPMVIHKVKRMVAKASIVGLLAGALIGYAIFKMM